MRLRRMFTRPKPVRGDDPMVDATDDDVVVRPRGPMQQWSRRPEPAMAAAAVASQEGPAWAPASWRDETDHPEPELRLEPEPEPEPAAAPRVRRRALAGRAAGVGGATARTKRDRAMETHPATAADAGRDELVVTHSHEADVLAVAAREIDRMAEEIRSNPSEDAELAMLQEQARRLEALTRANPFLRAKK